MSTRHVVALYAFWAKNSLAKKCSPRVVGVKSLQLLDPGNGAGARVRNREIKKV